MAAKWWERAFASLADAGTLFGLPPASVELVVLEEREREELAARRAAEARDTGRSSDDDDGDGGVGRPREPVAA